jgi:hypothetical protein
MGTVLLHGYYTKYLTDIQVALLWSCALVFETYVEQFLLPNLRVGQVIVIDNPGAHRASACASSSKRPDAGFCSCLPTRRI